MATHSSILYWEIPWAEEPEGLQSMWLRRIRHDWVTEHTDTRVCVRGPEHIQVFTSCLKPPWSKCKTCDSLNSVLMWTCYKPEGCITWWERVKSLRAALCSLTPGTQLKMVSIYLNPQLWQALDFGLVKLQKHELIFKVVFFFSRLTNTFG